MKLQPTARKQTDRFIQCTCANLWTFNVHHDGHRAIHLRRYFADSFDDLGHPLHTAVSHVQAHDIDAGSDQLRQLFSRFSGWSQRGHDLGVSVMTLWIHHRLPDSFEVGLMCAVQERFCNCEWLSERFVVDHAVNVEIRVTHGLQQRHKALFHAVRAAIDFEEVARC